MHVTYAPGDAVFGTTTGMGAYAHYLAVKAAAIAKKPSNLSFEEVASVPVPPKRRGREYSPIVTWKRDDRC
jgi:NADPH:quinone reductase-like Zn-dependent oxidoreductase